MLASCATGPYEPKSDPSSPESAGAPVVLLDKDLRRTLAADKVSSVRNENGFLVVQANLRNMTNDENLQVQVQSIYRGASGQVLYVQPGSEPAWDTYAIGPNQTIFYTSQSLSPEALNASIRIRYLARKRQD